jgi:hypothetical protein
MPTDGSVPVISNFILINKFHMAGSSPSNHENLIDYGHATRTRTRYFQRNQFKGGKR